MYVCECVCVFVCVCMYVGVVCQVNLCSICFVRITFVLISMTYSVVARVCNFTLYIITYVHCCVPPFCVGMCVFKDKNDSACHIPLSDLGDFRSAIMCIQLGWSSL